MRSLFQTEKALKDVGDKIDAAGKSAVEADIQALKDILAKYPNAEEMTDAQITEIKAAREKLMTSSQQLFTKMYEQGQSTGRPTGSRSAGQCSVRTGAGRI